MSRHGYTDDCENVAMWRGIPMYPYEEEDSPEFRIKALERQLAELQDWFERDARICKTVCQDNMGLRADLASARARVAELEPLRLAVNTLRVELRDMTKAREAAESALASARELIGKLYPHVEGFPSLRCDVRDFWAEHPATPTEPGDMPRWQCVKGCLNRGYGHTCTNCGARRADASPEPVAVTEARKLLDDASTMAICEVDYVEFVEPWLERYRAWLQRYPGPKR